MIPAGGEGIRAPDVRRTSALFENLPQSAESLEAQNPNKAETSETEETQEEP